MTKKTFIGVAWPYVNGDLHPGHLAGCYIPADIFARYSRLKGNETLMVSGTDCWGTPITIEADKKGVLPQDIVNEYNPRTKALMKKYLISFDLFTETITENHQKITQEFFLNLLKNGYIIKKTSTQYYSEDEKKYLPDRYVEGVCSFCGAKDQRGDQCEACGRSLAVGELNSPKSKLTGSEVVLKETEHYFVDLAKLQPEIKDYLEKQSKTGEWRDWVINEALGWTKEGLEPRAITRDIDWGVKIPVEEIEKLDRDLLIDGAENKRFYVWFDAVIGYYSAAIEWSKRRSENSLPENGISYASTAAQADDWKKFWLDKETKHYYFVGKDNLFFHTIWWQAILLGQRRDLKLSDNTPVNQFLNLESQKFSKSRGIYINPIKLADSFSVDYIRFYLSTIMPENRDANWKWDEFRDTINGELVGNFGNFIHRTLVFYKNKLHESIDEGNFEIDEILKKNIDETFTSVRADLEKANFVQALNAIFRLSKTGNQYFDQQKPWATVSTDRNDSEKTIFNCLQIVHALEILLEPFIPESIESLRMILGSKQTREYGVDSYTFSPQKISELKLPETLIPLFKKIEQEDIDTFREN